MGYLLASLVWMTVILFLFGRTAFSSRSIVSWLRHLFPAWDARLLSRLELVARKGFHVAGYFVLGFLLLRGLEWSWGWASRQLGKRARGHGQLGHPSAAGEEILIQVTLLLILCFAVADEVHQSYVPERVFSERDVLIDIAGAVLGVMISSRKRPS